MKNKSQVGIIKTIILIIIAIAILSYFGINLNSILGFIVDVWNTYLAGPLSVLVNVWVKFIWTPFLNSLSSVNS
jgi:hypothetical protein